MVAPHFSALEDAKRALRARLVGATQAIDGAALRANLHALLATWPHLSVAGVWPMPGEPDLRPLLDALDAEGRALALPVVEAPGRPLGFRRWRPGDPLVRGPSGTRHPAADVPLAPDIILVPLVAFDGSCRRLGRGGGFYDRTLAARPGARAIGFAEAAREVPAVPVAAHDRALDAIATERGIVHPPETGTR